MGLEDLGVTELFLLIALVLTLFVAYKMFKPPPPKKTAPVPVREEKKKEEDVSKPKMSIFYGSQSGTAETFATELVEEARSYGFRAKAIDLEEFDADEMATEPFAVFLMATFGEGEPTDNAQQFYEWICSEDREEGQLTNLTFAVFALGNRQYEHFCAVGRKVDKVLEKMSANRLLEHGEGDDDGSLEDDYSEWKGNFWTAARARFGQGGETGPKTFVPAFECGFKYHESDPNSEESRKKAKARAEADGDDDEDDDRKKMAEAMRVDIKLTSQQEEQAKRYKPGLEGFAPDSKFKCVLAPVVENKELRQEYNDDLCTRHLELDTTGLPINYTTADNLGIYPRNDFKLAGQMANRLGLHPKTLFFVKNRGDGKKKIPFPSPCSVQDALLWYCDFQQIPRMSALAVLAHYCTNPVEKQQMLHFTADGKEAFVKDEKSMLELLEEFPSCAVPWEAFLEIVPRIQPRFYTIASSNKVTPKRIHLTVSMSTADKPRGRKYYGLCSHFMRQCSPERKDKMCVFVRTSTFRLPKTAVPIIMVGPGTGVAPFRGFLQEANYFKREGKELGKWILFFGCRSSTQDFIYRDELEAARDSGILSQLHLAFSRESKSDRKVYVQTIMSDEKVGREIWELIKDKNASFYVCGGTAMGRAIRECVTSMGERFGGLSPTAAADFVKTMQSRQKFIQELWS